MAILLFLWVDCPCFEGLFAFVTASVLFFCPNLAQILPQVKGVMARGRGLVSLGPQV
jgi:hypothetical protein